MTDPGEGTTPAPDPTDDELMARGAEGDEGAFRLLVRRWEAPVFAFLERMLGSPEEAQDLAQEAFLRVCRQAKGYRPEGRFKSWLATLVNNRVRTLARRREERQGETRDFLNEQDIEHSPEETFERIWLEEHLLHCLSELRSEVEDKTFRAFQSYVIEQRPLEEVCAALDLQANNLYTIKWRMTERIAAKMKELTGDAE